MTGSPLKTLHIDIEGGWGGSSRSLFELVRRLDRERVHPLVAHRQEGPLVDWYKEIGIRTVHVPEIGSYVPRATKAFKNLVASSGRLARLGKAARRLAYLAQSEKIGLIHANYEGLFLLAAKLKRRTGLPIIAHSRAHMPADRWGRWVIRSLDRNVDHMLFISPNEASRFAELSSGAGTPGDVLWNIGRLPAPRRPFADPPEAVYFGSIDYSKGTDRLIDVAAALREIQAPPLVIAVYGKERTSPDYMREIKTRIETERLSDRIDIRGYTTDPMAAMAGAVALIRPSRDNDPWGRDVIEATRAGLPVIAAGSFRGVVQPGETGYLLDPFEPATVAAHLTDLIAKPELWKGMSAAAQTLGEDKFSGAVSAARFMEIAEDLATRT